VVDWKPTVAPHGRDKRLSASVFLSCLAANGALQLKKTNVQSVHMFSLPS